MPRSFRVATVFLLLAGCGGAQPPHPASANAVPPQPGSRGPAVATEPAPDNSVAASDNSAVAPDNSAAAPDNGAAAGSKLLAVTTTMPMDGSVDGTALKNELNQQLSPLDPCVALIRKTDQVVGSLNLQVKIDGSGAIAVELQSPVNPEAKRCLLQGFRSWHVKHAGKGTAMALLQLSDKPAQR